MAKQITANADFTHFEEVSLGGQRPKEIKEKADVDLLIALG
jgi:hypothetical protein